MVIPQIGICVTASENARISGLFRSKKRVSVRKCAVHLLPQDKLQQRRKNNTTMREKVFYNPTLVHYNKTI